MIAITSYISLQIDFAIGSNGNTLITGANVADDKWADFTISSGGTNVESLSITAASNTKLPSCELAISDGIKFFDAFYEKFGKFPNDGDLIRITIKADTEIKRYFRIFDWARVPAGTGFHYKFTGYWDAPRYWCGSASTGWSLPDSIVLKATSSNLLKSISDLCLLVWSPTNDATNDLMTWQPHNRFYGDWAREVASAGFIDETSLMVFGVDSTGNMRYRNVNKADKPTINLGFTHDASSGKTHAIQGFSPKARSGLYNSSGGYKHLRYVQKIVAGTETVVDISLNLSAGSPVVDAKHLARSQAVALYNQQNIMTYSPIDFKQVGENYEKGRYQNSQYNLLNSVIGEFLLSHVSTLELADRFNFTPPKEQETVEGNDPYRGEYTVMSKTIFIRGSEYHEKVIAIRTGVMEKK